MNPQKTGTINESSENSYQISGGGKALMKIYDLTTRLYNLDDKLVHPQEVDVKPDSGF